MKPALDATAYAARRGGVVEALDENAARLNLPFKEEKSNPGDALHGGVAASMIDLGGLAVAGAALGEEARPIRTASIQVTYLAAAIGEAITAEATLLRRGKEICFVDIAVATDSGKPIARGLATVRARFAADEAPGVKAIGHQGPSDPGPTRTPAAARVLVLARPRAQL